MQILVERRIYPFLLMVVMLLAILFFQIRQFKRLYEHIKNDKSVDPDQFQCDFSYEDHKLCWAPSVYQLLVSALQAVYVYIS